MRLLRRQVIGGTAGLLAGARAASAQSTGRLYALIVGIDRYPYLRHLRGCLNDARLIEAAVRPVAASVTSLLDEQATRGAFLRAWDALVAAARPGDTLLVTFSGHGGQTPELTKGNEADGLDENLIMYPFHPRLQPNNAERIVDDELGDRFARSGTRGIRSIFLADCCHSGTLTRSPDPRSEVLGHRSIPMQNIDNDMLAGLPITPSEAAGQANLLFIAAGQENQLVPEIRIEGQVHGAASHTFARVFSRAVSTGHFPSTEAFYRDVIAGTRARAEGKHHPLAENRLPPEEPLLPSRAAVAVSQPSGQGPLRLHVLPGGGHLADAARAVPEVVLVDRPAEADAVLDPHRAELVSGLGDLLAVALDPGKLVSALEKVRAIARIAQRNLPAMEVGLVPRGKALAPGGANSHDQLLTPGMEFDLVIRPPRPAALVAISLAADGVVRLLTRPDRAASLSASDIRQGVRVTPPAGAAHVLAIAASAPVPDLYAGLAALDCARSPAAAVREMLRLQDLVALAHFGFYVSGQARSDAPQGLCVR